MTAFHERSNDRLLGILPPEQMDRVFNQDMCDIGTDFLGFVGIYEYLSEIVPHHWTVVDLGCAYAPQAFFFTDHKAYVGVDLGLAKERFVTPNSTHHVMPIAAFVAAHLDDFDQATTFAICSYVPPWGGADNMKIARDSFKNVFTYYPAGGKRPTLKAIHGA